MLQRAAHRGHEIDARTLRMSLFRARRRHDAVAAYAALPLQLDGSVGTGLRKNVASDSRRVGSGAGFDLPERSRHRRGGRAAFH
jgi:hypothetical protein